MDYFKHVFNIEDPIDARITEHFLEGGDDDDKSGSAGSHMSKRSNLS